MPAKEFLLNKNEVIYCTSCSSKFEPNFDGVVLRNDSQNTFCIEMALYKRKIVKPHVNIAKAVPFREVKEKFIERNFNVIIPVGTKTPELDSFLVRVGKLSDEIEDGVEQSQKGIRKIKKGDSIQYKAASGRVILKYGEKVGTEEYFKEYKDGPITELDIPVRISIKPNSAFHRSKRNHKDSIGNEFDFYTSPEEDIIDEIKDVVKSEVNTICSTSIFKIVIKTIDNIKCIDKDSGQYEGIVNAKMLSLIDE